MNHGDLHLRNIALIDGRPVPFDAIEFDESLATIDILYDIAFLLMDLWQRGFRREANHFLNRYLWACSDLPEQIEALAILPALLSLRAAIRAKVAALPGADGKRPPECVKAALPYFNAALTFIAAAPAKLVAIGGLSGTGKTTLAAAMAPSIGRAPGALHLRSDIESKRLFGIAEREHLAQQGYNEEASQRCYSSLREQASTALAAGHSVVMDAVHARPAERDALARIAAAAGASFVGIWREAPADLLVARVAARQGDASDADANVVVKQLEYDVGEINWVRLDARSDTAVLTQQALDLPDSL